MSKHHYWLKLKKDFFSSLKIKKLRKMASGNLFTLIYLEIQLLSAKSSGILSSEGGESSFEEKPALALDEDVDSVWTALVYLQNQGMIKRIDDGEYLIPDAIQNVESESDSVARMRTLREKCAAGKKVPLHCDMDVRGSDKNVTPDTERDREQEKKREGEAASVVADGGLVLPRYKQKFKNTPVFRPDGRLLSVLAGRWSSFQIYPGMAEQRLCCHIAGTG